MRLLRNGGVFSNAHGSLQQGSGALLWCFDLLYLNGDKLMLMPLDQRKGLLGDVVSQADDEHLQFSGDFDDPIRLLDTCQKMGFEGIVSKRRDPGSVPARDWLKIKTVTWRAANRDRWELSNSVPANAPAPAASADPSAAAQALPYSHTCRLATST